MKSNFFRKDKESKWRENAIRHIRKRPQNMLGQLLLVWPNAKMPTQNLKLGTALSQMIFEI